jgi:hypothetical protein
VNLGHRTAGDREGRAARAVVRVVAAVRPISAICAAIAVSTLALPSTSGASPAPSAQQATGRPNASATDGRSGPRLTLAISTQYQVTVPPGTWVPVTLSVTNRGPANLHGEIVVQAPAVQEGLSTPGCLANGPSTFSCFGSEDYSSALAPGEPYSTKNAFVHYTVPLELAAGTAKQLPLYLLTGPPGADVSARVQGPSGRVLAQASAQLPVAYGLAQPAVLVVTDSPSSVSVLSKLVAPTGAQPQLQYTAPSALPAAAAPLGAFRAITVDQADTSDLSPAQGEALESYVEAGGTLVVAGGLDWRAASAGLPASLLPGHATDRVSTLALPDIARLLGTSAVPGKVDVDGLEVTPGDAETLVQGASALVLEGGRGRGHVVLCAFDPAASPLATWPGTPALLSRLFAPAYQPGYYDSPLPYAEAGGVYPVPPSNSPPGVVAKLGGNFDTGSSLMSPITAISVLAAYFGQAPAVTRPPAAGFLGLLLLGYVALVGLVLSMVFGRHRRRAVAWAAVPTLAITAAVATSLAGVGAGGGPLVQEVRLAQLPAGGHLAQVLSLGMVQLPGGGSQRVELSGLSSAVLAPPLVGNLALGRGTEVTVGPGPMLQGISVTVSGGPRSRGGWAASETAGVSGSIRAHVTQSGDVLIGTVRNDLGVRLNDAEVVLASGEAAQELGTLGPGRSTQFELAVSPISSPWPQAFGAPVPIASDQATAGSAEPGTGAPAATPGSSHGGTRLGVPPNTPGEEVKAAGAARREAEAAKREVEMALGDLAAAYSTQQGGAPVFVAMAAHKLFPLDAGGGRAAPTVTDVIIVPLAGDEDRYVALSGVPGELVGSTGVTGETEYAITTGSLTLEAGGSFDYQFLLPGTRWSQLELDLGSSSGETYGPALVGVKAYNYATSQWDNLRVRSHKGELLARVPDAAHHLGPGGALEVQVVADQAGVEVYGGFPTLSATPLESSGPPENLGPLEHLGAKGLTTAPYTLAPRAASAP